jgi:hypothetical protein
MSAIRGYRLNQWFNLRTKDRMDGTKALMPRFIIALLVLKDYDTFFVGGSIGECSLLCLAKIKSDGLIPYTVGQRLPE